VGLPFFGGSKRAKKLILVIEDDFSIASLLKDVLEGFGYAALTAGDGVEGIRLALKEKPDLIMTDVMMPKMDGFDTTRNLKSHPETKAIPILMCTSQDRVTDVERGLACGANDYIPKPIAFPRLQEKVLKLIGPPTPQ
jgi:CheY-like chemotaxis protein